MSAPRRVRPRVLLALLALTVALAAAPSASALTWRLVSTGSRTQRIVALTFDDGDSPAAVRSILATLQRADIPATFFPYANAMRSDPAAWRAVAAAGYPIGNHTVSHPELTRLGDASLRYEIAGATELIASLSGHAPINVLRPPYGEWNGRVAAVAAAVGYPTMMLWDVDPRDWSGISAAAITDRVLSNVRNGSVILLHAGPYHTPEALPAIIAGLQARGYGFVSIPQLLRGAPGGGTAGRAMPVPLPPHVYVAAPPRRPSPGRPTGRPTLLVSQAREERPILHGLVPW